MSGQVMLGDVVVQVCLPLRLLAPGLPPSLLTNDSLLVA